MGQKVHPFGFRLIYFRNWKSHWLPSDKKDYATFLEADRRIRDHVFTKFKHAAISDVLCFRTQDSMKVLIKTARPGVVIGRKGVEIANLSAKFQEFTGVSVSIDIEQIKKVDVDANLVADSVASQLERRVAFRRAMKKCLGLALAAGAKGVRIRCSGRLGGAEMARIESYQEGKIPLHTLRANILYGFSEAKTTYGIIGVKVWIYLGDFKPSEIKKMRRSRKF